MCYETKHSLCHDIIYVHENLYHGIRTTKLVFVQSHAEVSTSENGGILAFNIFYHLQVKTYFFIFTTLTKETHWSMSNY